MATGSEEATEFAHESASAVPSGFSKVWHLKSLGLTPADTPDGPYDFATSWRDIR
ncbi:MAG: hypothetical protein AAF623_07985 [Planctomycetota bacterium]